MHSNLAALLYLTRLNIFTNYPHNIHFSTNSRPFYRHGKVLSYLKTLKIMTVNNNHRLEYFSNNLCSHLPTMESGESDIELQSALPKVSNKKMPKSPSVDLLTKKQDKKSTKEMINQALMDLKTRKGVSLYAIKKYITEKYSVDTERLNYHIKKYIKSAVEQGSIVQLKGIGASGSFKLVPVKEKKVKPKKIPKEKADKQKNAEKKPKKLKEKTDSKEKTTKPKSKAKDGENVEKVEKPKKKVVKDKEPKVKKTSEAKAKKVKMAKAMQTPSKKKVAMMKRKSIGSIIKPPKMKPSKAKPQK